MRRHKFQIKDHDGTILTKKDFMDTFDGSLGLFEACWGDFLRNWGGLCTSVEEVEGTLECIAAEKVNNPKSRFWIYG